MKRVFLLLLLNICSAWGFPVSRTEMLDEIREYLPYLKDSPTGAIDAEGKYTRGSRKGLNCTGFAKWIVDGFYYPLTEGESERYMSLRKLREKHISERGTKDILVHEKKRDPYFGLDWTRNLAVELGKKRGKKVYYKSSDVTDSTIFRYVKSCGYPLRKIESVLTEQETLHPGRIYLGSINGFYGRKPRLWQHYHVVVFIPYYENDVLNIAVLERNKETSFAYLLRRYPDTYCHLVSITTEGDFVLMKP